MAYFINGGSINKNQAKRESSFKMEDRTTFPKEKIDDRTMEDDRYSMMKSAIDNDKPNSTFFNISNEDSIDDEKKSPDFIEFENLCCTAYNILRKEGHMLINMFLIMLSAGMPELQSAGDIDHMVVKLQLNSTDQEAASHFKKLIAKAMKTWSRRFDNFLHNMKAKYSK
jgi:hypothetical protein